MVTEHEYDEEKFTELREVLLGKFGEWLSVAGPDKLDPAETVDNTRILLDWKAGRAEGDDDLRSPLLWTVEDLREFLMDWCPQNVVVSRETVSDLPRAILMFVGFLDMYKMLNAASSTRDELLGVLDETANEYVSTMLQASLGVSLPPVSLPDSAAVARSRAEAPILAKFAALAEFVGDGRALTDGGLLTLSDARDLVALLDTGDAIDPEVDGRVSRTQSSADLPRLQHLFAWAKKAQVVRVAKGRVIATDAGLAIEQDPASFCDRALDALFDLGAIRSQLDPDSSQMWSDVSEFVDELLPHLLTGPYIRRDGVPMAEMIELATQTVLESRRFATADEDEVRQIVAWAVNQLFAVLALAGLTRTADGTAEATVELTPAGVMRLREILAVAGVHSPIAGQFADSTATELLLGVDLEDYDMLAAELEAWMDAHTVEDAAAQLGDAARDLEDPALRNLAMAALSDLDAELAVPIIRELAADPGTRGFALCWLVDRGHEDRDALFEPDQPFAFVDVLAHRWVTGGPNLLLQTLELAGNHAAQAETINAMWRSPSGATELVLHTIAEMHPTKVVAKAARKALFKRQSWQASG